MVTEPYGRPKSTSATINAGGPAETASVKLPTIRSHIQTGSAFNNINLDRRSCCDVGEEEDCESDAKVTITMDEE